MSNPYEVLGISENASEEEIKAAYKELVKKYHPDKYQNNPLADLAEEKLREVNEAYDYLMKNRTAGGGNAGGSTRADYAQIRRALDANDVVGAEAMLRNIQRHDAEWVFLDGMVSYKKGWYDDAAAKIQQACNMDPYNQEYMRALNTIRQQGVNPMNYRQQSMNRGYGNDTDDLLCKAAQCYICGDCAGCW